MNKEILMKLKHKNEVYKKWKQGQEIQETQEHSLNGMGTDLDYNKSKMALSSCSQTSRRRDAPRIPTQEWSLERHV